MVSIVSQKRQTLTVVFLMVLRILLQAITLISLIEVLSVVELGFYISTATLAVVLSTLSSMGSGFVMFSSVASKKETADQAWRFSWPISLITSSALVVLFVAICYFLLPTPAHSIFWLYIAITEIVLTPLIIILSQCLQANGKVKASQCLLLLPVVARFFAILFVLYMESQDPMLAFLEGQVIFTSLAVIIALAFVNRGVELFAKPSLASLQRLVKGAKFALNNFTSSCSMELDKVISGYWFSNSDIGIYNTASRLISALVLPVYAALVSLQMNLFELAEASISTYKIAAQKLVFIGLAFATLCYFLINVGAFVAIDYLSDSKYIAIVDLLPLLAITIFLIVLRDIARNLLIALGKPSLNLLSEIAGIACFVLLFLLFYGSATFEHYIGIIVAKELVIIGFTWYYLWRSFTKAS